MTKVSSENENDKIAKVADIVRADFANFCKWDEEEEIGYVRVFIVFDGKAKDIPALWTRGVMGRVRKRMYEADISELPILSPVSRSEWERGAKYRRSVQRRIRSLNSAGRLTRNTTRQPAWSNRGALKALQLCRQHANGYHVARRLVFMMRLLLFSAPSNGGHGWGSRSLNSRPSRSMVLKSCGRSRSMKLRRLRSRAWSKARSATK